VLYRTFPWDRRAPVHEVGGALFVARAWQGAGRHDNPDRYGALYCSTTAESAIAERLQAFRGQVLEPGDLRRADSTVLALAVFDDSAIHADAVVDLDDPVVLRDLSLRPSMVATMRRRVTQPQAAARYDDGALGVRWWSVLEAAWSNATLFAERIDDALRLAQEPVALTTSHPTLRAAADLLGVRL